MVTAVKYVQQGATAQPLVGWKDNTGTAGALVCGIDKLSTTYGTSIWRGRLERVGMNGVIKEVRIPLAQAVATNQTITAKIYVDDGSANTTIATINTTNYPASERFIKIYPQGVSFKNNFYLELTFSGSALATVNLPITYVIEVYKE